LYSDCYDAFRLGVAAGTLDHSGNPEAAIVLLRRAITLAPRNPDLRYQISSLLLQLGNKENALKELETCVEMAPYYEEGWALLSNFYRMSGNNLKADQILVEGITNCLNSPGLRLGWARRLVVLRRLEEASREYEIAISLHLEEADPYLELAMLYFQLKRTDEGIAALKEALNAQPGNPGALATLSLQAILSGDQAAANNWLQELERQPNASIRDLEELREQYRRRFENR